MLTTESNQKKYPVPFSRMQLVVRKVCKRHHAMGAVVIQICSIHYNECAE